jgi:hypothetical protein
MPMSIDVFLRLGGQASIVDARREIRRHQRT